MDFSLKEVVSTFCISCKKFGKIFASEFESGSRVMRGFQKGITLGSRTYGIFHNLGLQMKVAKKFAKFLHLICDPGWGS